MWRLLSLVPVLLALQLLYGYLSLFPEKDVNRTDRTNRFYEGIDNPGLALLHDILMTYCMYDFDLGESWRKTVAPTSCFSTSFIPVLNEETH